MKTHYPKVSIVIPVYNGSNYLKEAIDSALSQTYANIEIIVINDGSNDKGATEKIAKSYGKKIRYYKKKNGGVSTALNLGIEKMTGQYMSWLSHDDLLFPDKIEKQIDYINSLNDKKVVLYSNYAILQEGKINPVILHHEMLKRKKQYSLLRGSVNGITVLIPKKVIDEVGYFDDKLRCTQDYDYWRRIQKKYDFVHIEDVLSITRLHPQQDSNVSPNVIKEGDNLWIDMIKSLSDKEKIQLEGTIYNFYFEMIKFLNLTPYAGALEYCDTELSKVSKNFGKEMLNPKVSVVIPFYNRPKDTINSIKSAINQTYKNIEIILVDDASSNDIGSVVRYIKQYPNIKLVKLQKNSGAAAARNEGIKVATGDYIAFLDSDDEFMPKKIEEQIHAMMLHNKDISYTAYIKRVNGEDTIMSTHDISGVVVPRFISSCPIATPTVMVRRSLLIENNLFFNENMRIGEDTCFWLEIAKNSEILAIEKPLSVVNAHAASSAYDSSKLLIGLTNIISYLTSDPYYSSFHHDIALLARDYANLDDSIERAKSKRLEYDNKLIPSFSHIIYSKLITTKPYRLVRKIRRDGAVSAYKLTIVKVKSKIIGS